jgi:hypothetical protein
MARHLTTLFLAVILAVSAATAFAQDYDAWLRQAQLGPHQPAEDDWDAILEAARNEPPLVLYTETSRAFPMVDAFAAPRSSSASAASSMPASTTSASCWWGAVRSSRIS